MISFLQSITFPLEVHKMTQVTRFPVGNCKHGVWALRNHTNMGTNCAKPGNCALTYSGNRARFCAVVSHPFAFASSFRETALGNRTFSGNCAFLGNRAFSGNCVHVPILPHKILGPCRHNGKPHTPMAVQETAYPHRSAGNCTLPVAVWESAHPT